MRRPSASRILNDKTRRFSRNRLSRGRGLRKTTGCLTCRRRHIKCDETKPSCGACLRIRESCSWPTSDRPQATPGTIAFDNDVVGQHTSSLLCHRGARLATVREYGGQADSPHGFGSTGDAAFRSIRESTHNQSVSLEVANALANIRNGFHHTPGSMSLGSNSGKNVADSSSSTTHAVTQNGQSDPVPRQPGSDYLSANSTNQIVQQESNTPHTPHSSGSLMTDWVDSDSGIPACATAQDATNMWATQLLKDASSRTESSGDWGFTFNASSEPCDAPVTFPASLSGTTFSPETTSREVGVPIPVLDDYHPRRDWAKQPSQDAHHQQELEDWQPWRSATPVQLQPRERLLFHDFIENLSQWMDFLDPKRPFYTLVPHLAMRNRGLMNAILALSIRHLSLNVRFQTEHSQPQDPVDALPFYFTTLHYIREAMQYDSYKSSLELLATASIVSAYEMLDGSRRDWERHLRGLSGIQRSQNINGDSGGLKQAVWWAWFCQDVWAAWREGRKPLTTWSPTKAISELDSFEMAARSIYLFGQAVAFCSYKETENEHGALDARLSQAQTLRERLKEWRSNLSVEFDALPIHRSSGDDETPFRSLWIHPPIFGVAVQFYHCAEILIITSSPCLGGMREYQVQRNQLDQHIRIICGVAMSLTGDPESVMCSQALYIAGLFVNEPAQRQAVLDLLESCWHRAGWPLASLGVDLEREWMERDQDGTSESR